MRKVLLVVLILSLVLGSITIAFAAAGSVAPDVIGTEYEDAVNVLMDLGIVSGYENGEYQPENIVTRAEMAVLIVRALGLEGLITKGVASSFSDMDGYGWAQDYVGYAQRLGIVSGYTDGTFDPGKTVSYDEAATMLVAALGYTPASLNGSWPANYVSQARALGILKDITIATEGVTRGDVAIMLYQTLDCEIGTVNSAGNWSGQRDYMLERLGVGKANDGDAFVLTDAIARDKSVINVQHLVGAYVTAYVNEEDEIITISELKSEFLTGKMKSGKFNADSVEYTISGTKFENGQNGSGALTFYNGALQDDVISSVDDVPSYNVTIACEITGKAIRSVYSVNDWSMSNGEHGYFDSKVKAEIANDHTLLGIDLPEDVDGKIDYKSFVLLGAQTLDKIPNNAVVYTYYNRSDEITRVTVSTETVKGTVTRISADENSLEAEYTIEGKKYSFAAEDAVSENNEIPSTGDTVTAHLNYDGDIYEMKITDGKADKFAVVLDVSGSISLAGDSFNKDQIRLYLANNTNPVFDIDEDVRVKVDGVQVSKSQRAPAINGLVSGSIIEYGLNSSGEIDKIDITSTAIFAESNFVKNGKVTSKGIFDVHQINSKAVIFALEDSKFFTGSASKGDYSIARLSQLRDTTLKYASYILDKDGEIVAMLINNTSSGSSDVYGVPLESAQNTSSPGYERQFLVGRSKKTYNVTEEVTQYADTALYMLIFDSKGDVIDLEKMEPVFEIRGQAAEFALKVSNYGLVIGNPDVEDDQGNRLLSDPDNYLKGGNSASMDRKVFVYTRSASSSEYAVGNTRDIQNAVNEIEFYSVYDDGLIDFVLVNNKM